MSDGTNSPHELESDEVLDGYWVTLEPLNQGSAREIENLDRQRELVPQMGGVFQRGLPTKRCGDPLAIRSRRENTIVGVLANQELNDSPGVCHITIYVDQAITRPGPAIEAFFLYTEYVFRHGAERIHVTIAEFNTPVLSIWRKLNMVPRVTQREHFYIAGRYWDTYLLEFNYNEWQALQEKYRTFLPGGDRTPRALGSTKIHKK